MDTVSLTIGGVSARALVEQFGSPLYVYDAAVLDERCRRWIDAFAGLPVHLRYAVKANANPSLLERIRGHGIGADAVSIGEVEAARRAGFATEHVSYTPNNAADDEIDAVFAMGITPTIDATDSLLRFMARHSGAGVTLRLNTGIGGGHHRHVVTGGADSKFGIEVADFDHVLNLCRAGRVQVQGLHQHIGSGIHDDALMARAVTTLLDFAERCPDLRFVDFGGGFGVQYRRGETDFPLDAFLERIARSLRKFAARRPVGFEFRFQPGRVLVAESGTLLCRVTTVKRGAKHTFAGVDTGMHHLLRPALYGAYHDIVLAGGAGGPVERYTIAGQICESGDILGEDRPLPRLTVGDVLAIRTAGAYGFSMASTYNLRPLPREVIVTAGVAELSPR